MVTIYNKEFNSLLRQFILSKDIFVKSKTDRSRVKYDFDRNNLIEHLCSSPFAYITTQRMYRRFGYLIENHVGYIDRDDLVSIAMIALVKIVDDYDPSRGHEFKKCAINRMRQAILSEIRKGFRGGRGALENVNKRIYEVSLDNEIDTCESERPFRLDVPSEEESPWVSVQKSDIRNAVYGLPSPEREIVYKKHFEQMSIEESGASMGIPRSTSHEIYHRGLEILSKNLVQYANGIDTM